MYQYVRSTSVDAVGVARTSLIAQSKSYRFVSWSIAFCEEKDRVKTDVCRQDVWRLERLPDLEGSTQQAK
jgi:hypothetical protein